jgi:hypothetical protein
MPRDFTIPPYIVATRAFHTVKSLVFQSFLASEVSRQQIAWRMLAAMRQWYRLIREGHSSRSRDGNGRACEALQGQAPVPPALAFRVSIPAKSG